MIGDWQDEWDLKRRGSDRSVNRHDTCRVAAYLNQRLHPIRGEPDVGQEENDAFTSAYWHGCGDGITQSWTATVVGRGLNETRQVDVMG